MLDWVKHNKGDSREDMYDDPMHMNEDKVQGGAQLYEVGNGDDKGMMVVTEGAMEEMKGMVRTSMMMEGTILLDSGMMMFRAVSRTFRIAWTK